MSMKRFVGLGVFALSASGLITIAACDDSATTAQPTGTGATTTTTQTGNGGSTVTGQGGATTGNGGTTVTGNGGSGNTTSTGCDASVNLVANALANTSGTNWVGGDPTSTADDPCGVQGAFYAYSDKGLDNTVGGTDASVQWPALVDPPSGEERQSPCDSTKGGCCISGTTSKWPVSGSTTDYTASVWGGGLGLSLNDPGAGGTKKAYSGPVKGWSVTVSGSLNGQVLRVGYTQSATDACAPFVQKSAVGTFDVPFTGSVTCPTWACTPACIPPTATPYDLQVQVVGGDAAGAFDICVTSIKPML